MRVRYWVAGWALVILALGGVFLLSHSLLARLLVCEGWLLLAAGAYVTRVLRRNNGLAIKTEGAAMTPRPCGTCDGLGVMWLTGGRLIPIPQHLRETDPLSRTIQPKLANTQDCPACQGRGSYLVARRQVTAR